MASASRDLEVIANVVTPFTPAGALDEPAYRAHLQRMVGAGVGVFTGSPGSGAVHSLTREEFRRTCAMAVEVAGGRVPVYSMTPELHDPSAIVDFARIAAEAGVDEVQLFQLMGGHGMKPTQYEQLDFWRSQLSALDHPIALSLHGIAGYFAPPSLIGRLCAEFPRIRTVYTFLSKSSYVLELRDAVPARVRIGGHILRGPLELALGATILTGAEPNVIPATSRALIDSFSRGDFSRFQESFQRIERLAYALLPWGEPNIRSLKMALRVLGLPGGGGPLRPPLAVPGEAELRKLSDAFDRIGIRDWENLRPAEGTRAP